MTGFLLHTKNYYLEILKMLCEIFSIATISICHFYDMSDNKLEWQRTGGFIRFTRFKCAFNLSTAPWILQLSLSNHGDKKSYVNKCEKM